MALLRPGYQIPRYWPDAYWQVGNQYWPARQACARIEPGYQITRYWTCGYWQVENQYWQVWGERERRRRFMIIPIPDLIGEDDEELLVLLA